MKFIRLLFVILMGLTFNANSQCNTNISICTPGITAPFSFNPPSSNPSTCLDFTNGNGANYAYITLYITQSGPLNLLINGASTSGCIDVSIFDITGQADPCASLSPATEISCNYASACDGCNEFGSTFPGCNSEVPAPNVNAGDVLMILVEDWSNQAGTFTLQLGPGAQTGPGDPTITPAGPYIDTDPAVALTAANGGGTWSASCGACIDPTTGVFNPSVAGNGTHNICYTLGASPCDATDCIDIIVGPSCNMTGITANAAITCPSTTYSTTGTVSFTTPPTTGTLTVSDCNGNQQVFNAPFTSPTNYTINNQSADGLACDITATFSATPSCTVNIGYTAPICPCNVDVFTANINVCDAATNSYSVNGNIEFSIPPSSGNLTISVDNGSGTTYDTIINAVDFNSPMTYSISGIPANGANSTITATFSADNACTNSIAYTAPADCSCNANIGTLTPSMNGNGQSNYVLCFGDIFDYQANGDYTAPPDVNDPLIPYNPGIGYLIYSCPPTPGMTPDGDPITGDPCILGLVLDGPSNQLFTDINDLGWINSFPAGTFTNNIIYWVPVTMYDINGNYYSATNTGTLCYDIGPAIPVQYLPEVKTIEVEDCQAGSITSTVTGGLSELDGSNYTVVTGSLLPTNASFQNTTAIHGGTITITGLTNGQNFSYDIIDANGCPVTVSGTFIGTENPGFNYSGYTFCTTDPDPSINITGSPGSFSYAVVSGGPTLTLNTTTGVIDLSTSNEGIYDITYLTNDPTCFSDSTVTMTINFTPTVNTVLDQTVCSGSNFTDVIFVGTASPNEPTTYNWTNDNTNIGLVTNGNDNILGFTGTNLTSAQISGLITVTPSTSSCVGTPTTFNYIVDPMDDPTFDYVNGLTYCLTGTNPVANISGTVGGTFSYTVISGGPNLGLNTTTGDIDLSLSQFGSYNITYTTPGVCQQTSTLTLDITNAPDANFSFGTYCLNGTDPMPDFVNDDTGNPFAISGNGGTFSETTGNLNINSNTGLVDLDASTAGTYTVTNTINIAGCALATATDDIVILPLPTAIISGGGTICPQGDLSTLNVQVDFTSTGPWDLNYTFNTANQNTNSASPFVLNGAQFGFGTYNLTDVTDANGCSNSATGSVVIDSFPTPSVHPMNNFSACEGDNLLIDPFVGFENGDIFHWVLTSGSDIGFGTSGTGNIGTFTSTNSQVITVQVTPESANGCFGPPIDFNITINPVPVAQFSADKLNGCEPTTIIFTNESLVGDTFEWTFGNGVTASGPTVSYNYEISGVYDIGLTVTTNAGCSDALMQNAYITITPTPVAAFSFTPYVTDISHTEIEFTNSSIDGDYYEWDFGDETALNNETDPIHNYGDIPSQYEITLLVTNNGGLCRDSTVGFLVVNDIILYYVPNVFTPDFDEFNQTFKPIFTSGFDPFDYHLQIYNRWGELIFESFNAAVGWDGTYPKDGKLCQDGVYVWKINFKESMSDKKHLVEGHVTLLR